MAFENRIQSGAGLTLSETAWVQSLAAVTPTKGTIYVGNGSTFVGKSVGIDGTFLLADSSQATGVRWASFGDDETPTGSVDGVNKSFTLAHAPNPVGSLILVADGQPQLQGTDYILASATITFTNAPQIYVRGWYRY